MHTSPLVSVFIDGLRPDWVARMPFVSSLGRAVPLGTVLGYSISCHATMYTGLPPQEHGLWFVWLRDPSRSPFPEVLRRIPRSLDNIPTRLLARKFFVRRLESDYPRGIFGVPRLVNIPVRNWPGLWISEERFWDEDAYVSGHRTIFELMRAAGTRYETRGFTPKNHLEAVATQSISDSSLDWIYLFFGEVDHAAHSTGYSGPHFDETLRAVDSAIEARCRDVERLYGSFDFLLFSDHGHRVVERFVDIYDRLGMSFIASYDHVIDTNFARFWTTGEADRDRLVAALERRLPEGRVMPAEELQHWGCYFEDGRYGDVIFYLDVPSAFARTAWGFSRSQRSIHGYLPSYDEMKGCLVTTLPAKVDPQLADIFDLHVKRLTLA